LPRIAATLNKVLKSDGPRLVLPGLCCFEETAEPFMRASVTVRVPGSTSNLGAGFDCVGVAVPRAIRVTARTARASAGPAVIIERRGSLRALAVPPEADLVYQGFVAACRRAGRAEDGPKPLMLAADSDIPVARGLGSSAAAIVAGAVAANALLDLALDDAALAALCTDVEGHPDNVAPALHGGATLALRGPGGGLIIAPLAVHASLTLVFAIPDFTVETKRARSVLPATVPHAQAAEAAAKSAALAQGLASGDARLLAAGLDDVLHVPYRRALVPGYDEVADAARRAGAYGATLSGSGPTLVAVADAARAAAVAEAMVGAWRARGVAAEGLQVARPAGGYEVA
jgi:homoserine kinase